MKHSPALYARAFAEVLSAKKTTDEAIVKNFAASVLRRGDEAHWDKIIREVERLVRKIHGARLVVIESARPLSKTQQKSIREAFSSSDVVEERISPDLIAGVKITVDGIRQFDGSLAEKVHKMFTLQ